MHKYINICTCMYIYKNICKCRCIYTYVCTNKYILVNIYIYIHIGMKDIENNRILKNGIA